MTSSFNRDEYRVYLANRGSKLCVPSDVPLVSVAATLNEITETTGVAPDLLWPVGDDQRLKRRLESKR